jgi:hypothetical protein
MNTIKLTRSRVEILGLAYGVLQEKTSILAKKDIF